ncbi:MAG: TlpA family protein disulfide reductase [Parvularculaceae bacterium]|nr:TlpA family protein disulfide reductase [Parvularculaceae bacterium]
MSALKSPRFWLVVWGAIGALAVVYVIMASSAKPGRESGAPVNARNPALAVGAMQKFEFSLAGAEAPDIAFEQPGGASATLAGRKGRVVLVNFWATWCAPCLEELPSLAALQAAKGGRDFEVVAIAADPRGRAAVEAFLEKAGATNLKAYLDAELRLATAMGTGSGLPLTILYDKKGREIGRLRGAADWASPEALRLVEAAIAAP